MYMPGTTPVMQPFMDNPIPMVVSVLIVTPILYISISRFRMWIADDSWIMKILKYILMNEILYIVFYFVMDYQMATHFPYLLR